MQALQQHDLRPAAADRILKEARIHAGDAVVEIGPGLGALTHGLLAAGATVQAVERDLQRVAHLQQRFAKEIAAKQLELIPGDALKWRGRHPSAWRVVANPPFNLTAPLLHRWLVEEDQLPWAVDLVLQRQTGFKLSPKPGDQSRSSVLVALAGRAAMRLVLTRDATTPPARVDLCLWSFRREDDGPSLEELRAVDKLLVIAFAGPHTVADALRGLATGIQVRRQAADNGWQPTDHPRQLPPQAWLAFAKLLMMCHKL
jgi:16S rRNA (adenine1518-N6/adenine1519-N6)-dimethyltransferase